MKQVILVNGWLDMPAGKIAAQVSHASMAFLTNWVGSGVVSGEVLQLNMSEMAEYTPWMLGSFTKLVLVVRTPEEYEQVMTRANKIFSKGSGYFEIIDAGRTVFNGVPTHTCTGFVPMEQDMINQLFGSLPLLK